MVHYELWNRVKGIGLRPVRSVVILVVIIAAVMRSGPVSATSSYDWPQFDGNAQHSGANTQETQISAANITTLHQLFRVPLGSVADGAPAYLSGVATLSGTRDILFVTTRTFGIIALDAHSGAVIWSHQVGPGTCTINSPTGTSGTCYTTSSPAVDPSRTYVYSYGIDSYTCASGSTCTCPSGVTTCIKGDLHKYQVGDGTEITGSGWPEVITYKPWDEKESSALSVATDTGGTSYIYVTTAGYPGDAGNYQGHVTSINLSTGSQTVFNTLCSNQAVHFTTTTPDCSEVQSGVWARPGAVYDSGTNRVFISSGNGTYNPASHYWGDSILALTPDGAGVSGGPIDSYTPTNYAALQSGDIDLGSTAPAVLQAVPAASRYQHLGVQGGKDAQLRLLNLANLSGQGGPGHPGGEVWMAPVPQGGMVLTLPATWINPADGSSWVFLANDSGLSGLKLTVDASGNPSLTTQWTKDANAGSGTSPIIANGVVYLVRSHSLIAVNPLSGAMLWSDSTIGTIHWESPIVANGVVYITDGSGNLTAYGLPPTATISASPNPVPAGQATTISWSTGSTTTGQVYVKADGGPETLFSQGPGGSASAPWIQAGHTYVFTLYAGTAHATVLAQVTVTGAASISANPATVTAPATSTAITWTTGDGTTGQIYVSANGGSETLFAQGPGGTANAPWIQTGVTYSFKLYGGTAHTTMLAQVTVTGAPAASISASPATVVSPSTTTSVTWSTGDGSVGQVYVRANGGSETLFAQGPSGTASAPWIQHGSTYVFTLYAGTTHTTNLAQVTVTGQ